MAIRNYRPITPGTRTRVASDFSEITGRGRERGLVIAKHRRKGRNNRGVITCRHRGGGHKRLYRIVDFRRDKHGVIAKVAAIHYDPHRNARLALLFYADGEKRYLLAPAGIELGQHVISGPDSPIETGNALPKRGTTSPSSCPPPKCAWYAGSATPPWAKWAIQRCVTPVSAKPAVSAGWAAVRKCAVR